MPTLLKIAYLAVFAFGLNVVASAEETYLFAYYVDIKHRDSSHTLQEHGLSLSRRNAIRRDLGQTKVQFSLLAVEGPEGLLTLNVLEQSPETNVSGDPALSLEVNFKLNGRQEASFSDDNYTVELVFSVVKKPVEE